MATLEERVFELPLTSGLRGIIRRTFARMKRWHDRRRTWTQLSQLSERQLKDAGFGAADICDRSLARLPVSAWIEPHMRPDKPLVRVNASWMELFTIYADGEDIRARFIMHLSDFTGDHASAPGQVNETLIERCVTTPEDVSYFFPRGEDIFGVNVRGSASIHKALACPQMLRAIRRFNLTHMNRGRNAYHASHSYSVADHMLEG